MDLDIQRDQGATLLIPPYLYSGKRSDCWSCSSTEQGQPPTTADPGRYDDAASSSPRAVRAAAVASAYTLTVAAAVAGQPKRAA